MIEVYRIQAFARLAGVTVRALHHYDRMGLLRPQRTAAGYRAYGKTDLERLEQIVALRSLGLPLREIREALQREQRTLPEVLRAQRYVLQARCEQLRRAIAAIERAEKAVQAGHSTTTLLAAIIKEIDMQEKDEFMNRYYNEGAQATMEHRRQEWDPAHQERVTQEWRDLFRDVKAALHEDPAGPGAQDLLNRWSALVANFTGGDADVQAGLGKAWADRDQWPADLQGQTNEFSDPQVWAFIQKAGRSARSE